MTGYVYAIRAGGLVKIGFSADPATRCNKIKADSPLPVRMMGVVQGGEADEAALHQRFASYRSHGEWFLLKGAVAEWVCTLDDCPKAQALPWEPGRVVPLSQPFGPHPLRHWREMVGVTLDDLATEIGTTRQSLSRIETGRQTPSLELAMRIEAATNGAVTASALGSAMQETAA